MALSLLSSTQASTLTLQELQRYPDSTLAKMVSTVSPEDGPVVLDLDQVLGSPLGAWPEAVNITVALYRDNHKALLTSLSKMLKAEPTAKVFGKLKALVDYLDLPDPVDKLLPPFKMVTIKYLPVLDLHYYALAGQAVDLMVNSSAFTSSRGITTWKAKAAYFFVSTNEDSGWLEGLRVYAVGGGNLGSLYCAPGTWQHNHEAQSIIDAGYYSSVKAMLLGNTPRSQQSASVPLYEIYCADTSNGLSSDRGISAQHPCLGKHIQVLLEDAASSIMSTGPAGSGSKIEVGCKCVTLGGLGMPYYLNLWVIHW